MRIPFFTKKPKTISPEDNRFNVLQAASMALRASFPNGRRFGWFGIVFAVVDFIPFRQRVSFHTIYFPEVLPAVVCEYRDASGVIQSKTFQFNHPALLQAEELENRIKKHRSKST